MALLAANVPQSQYKLYCMYTPKFETMYTQYFLPSLKDDFEIITEIYPQTCISATYRTEGWDKTMLDKLKLLQRAIHENWEGDVFFYSDVDIIFLAPILEKTLKHLGDNDFVVQQGWPRNKLCAGFFVMRGNKKQGISSKGHTNYLKSKTASMIKRLFNKRSTRCLLDP